MSTYQLTVEVEAESTEVARLLASQAGFTVKRVTQPRIATPATLQHPFARASAALDMPPGLNRYERQAYLRGYSAACLAHMKKDGIPGLEAVRQVEWDRHPAAHKKGLAELAAYRLTWGAYDAQKGAAA